MVCLSNMNHVLWVDPVAGLACIEAGARIADVVEELRKYNMVR